MSPANFLQTSEPDMERLVNNPSVNSFNSETNELTVTHSIGDRRYSKMCIKHSVNNTMDIVITNGEIPQRPAHQLSPHIIGSREIRKQYSKCAKFGLGFVLLMLVLMFVIMIIALLTSPSNIVQSQNDSSPSNSTVRVLSDSTFMNFTSSENVTSVMH